MVSATSDVWPATRSGPLAGAASRGGTSSLRSAAESATSAAILAKRGVPAPDRSAALATGGWRCWAALALPFWGPFMPSDLNSNTLFVLPEPSVVVGWSSCTTHQSPSPMRNLYWISEPGVPRTSFLKSYSPSSRAVGSIL